MKRKQIKFRISSDELDKKKNLNFLIRTMKNLYIIGNGFDKHHEIPSGYWDFHEWLKEKNKPNRISDIYLYRMIKADHHANKGGIRSYGRGI